MFVDPARAARPTPNRQRDPISSSSSGSSSDGEVLENGAQVTRSSRVTELPSHAAGVGVGVGGNYAGSGSVDPRGSWRHSPATNTNTVHAMGKGPMAGTGTGSGAYTAKGAGVGIQVNGVALEQLSAQFQTELQVGVFAFQTETHCGAIDNLFIICLSL
jgi:hypothetical protein